PRMRRAARICLPFALAATSAVLGLWYLGVNYWSLFWFTLTCSPIGVAGIVGVWCYREYWYRFSMRSGLHELGWHVRRVGNYYVGALLVFWLCILLTTLNGFTWYYALGVFFAGVFVLHSGAELLNAPAESGGIRWLQTQMSVRWMRWLSLGRR